MPVAGPELSIEYRHGGSTYPIVVREPGRVRAGEAVVVLDGVRLPNGVIPLVDDGRGHRVEVGP